MSNVSDAEVIGMRDLNNETPTDEKEEKSALKKVRVPRLYVVAAKALTAQLEGRQQQKKYIFRQDKARNLRRLKRVASLAFQFYDNIIGVLKSNDFPFDKCDEKLAAVIAADVAFSSENYQPTSLNHKVREVLRHKGSLQFLNDVKAEIEPSKKQPVKYGVINRLLVTKEKLEEDLQSLGFTKQTYIGDKSNVEEYDTYLRGFDVFDFIYDIHFPDEILVFHPKCGIQSMKPVLSRKLLLINKCAFATVKSLGAQKMDHVIDCCSAPGNKSILIAQTCKFLTCFERKEVRCAVLNENLESAGVFKKRKCQVQHADFVRLEPNDDLVKNCTMALVDPSCSGGGELGFKRDAEQIRKLSNLQAVILKKALAIPSVRTVVYSTCSRETKENEGVVREVLEWIKNNPQLAGKWTLETALPELPFRRNLGDEYADIGERCLFFDENISITTVQFVAKFVASGKYIQKLKRTPEIRKKLKRLRHKQRKRQKVMNNKSKN